MKKLLLKFSLASFVAVAICLMTMTAFPVTSGDNGNVTLAMLNEANAECEFSGTVEGTPVNFYCSNAIFSHCSMDVGGNTIVCSWSRA